MITRFGKDCVAVLNTSCFFWQIHFPQCFGQECLAKLLSGDSPFKYFFPAFELSTVCSLALTASVFELVRGCRHVFPLTVPSWGGVAS